MPCVGVLAHCVWSSAKCSRDQTPWLLSQAVCPCVWGALISVKSVGIAGDCFINCGGLVAGDFTAEMDRA